MSTDLKLLPSKHPHEDVFEDYAFDRLSEGDLANFEEHLLICDRCQETLAQTDKYIRMMKTATAAYVAKTRGRAVFRFPERGVRRNLAAIAAILLLGSMTVLLSWRTPAVEPQEVALVAKRGPVQTVDARRPLDLKIDVKKLQPAPGYRVEVVDATGKRIWFGGTPAHIGNGLPRGTYWVRVFTESGEFLQESGLRAW